MSSPRPMTHGPLLPVVALVLSVVGLCFPPLLLISGGLGLYGFLRARREPAWAPRKQVTQMTMAVSGAGLLIFLGLALPNFKRYQLRTRQFECRTQLAAIYEGERRLYEQEKRYSTRPAEVVPTLERGRSLIRFEDQGPLWTTGARGADDVGLGFDETQFPTLSTSAVDAALPQLVRAELGLTGQCPGCSLTVVCATQLDADPTIDVWTVSTKERTGNHGERIAGGVPWNERDDVSE